MTHTKGPWRVSDNELGYECYDILADTGLGWPNIGIATVIDGRFSDTDLGTVALHKEVCQANARLIAAAVNSYDKHCGERAVECAEDDLLGDLLEALKKTIVYIGDELYEAKESFQSDLYITNLEKLLEDCKQAIAKAEGKE